MITTIEPTYGRLVEVYRRYGIKRTRAFQLARDGHLKTFKLGRGTFVDLDSVRTPPNRIGDRP